MRNTAPALLGDKVLASTDFVDQVTDLEGRAQLEAHVFHHHVTVEEQQSLPIDLLSREYRHDRKELERKNGKRTLHKKNQKAL